jgi:hypothetical protein
MKSEPTPFLWVIRVLASVFLLGYLTFGFLAAYILEFFPGENALESSIFVLLLLIFLVGFYFLWFNREGLAGLMFMLWYASIWLCEIYIAGDNFEDLPAPGTFMFIVAILSLIYWYKKRRQKDNVID